MFHFLPELDEFLQDLDEDVEGMQSTIYLLKNELQKYKASMKNTEHKKTNPKTAVNGIKKEAVIIPETPSISKSETPKQLVEIKSDVKLSKQDKSKDSKLLNCKKNRPKVKSQPAIAESTVVKSGKIPDVHKSDGSKSEGKRKKSEKKTKSKSEVVLKKSKSDQSKSTEVNTPVTVINRLPNGS